MTHVAQFIGRIYLSLFRSLLEERKREEEKKPKARSTDSIYYVTKTSPRYSIWNQTKRCVQ